MQIFERQVQHYSSFSEFSVTILKYLFFQMKFRIVLTSSKDNSVDLDLDCIQAIQ